MTWDISPELLSIGPITVRWYGLCFAVGFLIGNKYVGHWFARLGLEEPEKQLNRIFTYIFVGTLIGARLAHCLFYDPSYYLQHIWEIPMIWKGGLASHGGYTGVIIAIWLFSRKCKELSFWQLTDLLSLPSLFAGVFIRLGNLFNSEIIGKQTDGPFGVVFTRYDGFARHPTQVYEMLSYLTISIVLFFLYPKVYKTWQPGRVLGLTLMLGMGARFFIEFTKMTQSELVWGMAINMGQILSTVMFLFGAWMFFKPLLKKSV